MGIAGRAGFFVSALLLGGCGSVSAPEWENPDKDVMELKADMDSCQRFFGASERAMNQCLSSKGWTRVKR